MRNQQVISSHLSLATYIFLGLHIHVLKASEGKAHTMIQQNYYKIKKKASKLKDPNLFLSLTCFYKRQGTIITKI